ncbi:trehalose-phosphatase [Sphingoaurantiacus capsulatus]|uniref:Trehalose 6-phosphate phosphatase n=1 Tax=Sphingoaurantiacus capsulatus TaxID=1771310 RepID=A0ABV7X743_9SPHN
MSASSAFALDSAPLGRPPAIEPARDALFLDLDGTLAPIAATPDLVVLPPDVGAALVSVQVALDGRVAVISGRSVADLGRLVGLPALYLAGVHGLERRFPDGRAEDVLPSAEMAAARGRIAELAGREPRLLVEDKGLGIAVHFRLAPDLGPLVEREVRDIAADAGLTVQTGKMVVELRQPGADKGAAVGAFMEVPPFAGARPIFVGDDDTDECAFEAVAALGGYGVLVGEPRVTAATYRLDDVTAVGRWLAEAAR